MFEAKSAHNEKMRVRKDVSKSTLCEMTCKAWFRDIPPSPQADLPIWPSSTIQALAINNL